MEYLKKFDKHTDYDAAKGNLIRPNVSLCVEENEVHYNPIHDYSKDYLTFVALDGGTFKLSRNAVQYSLDDGVTWTTLAANTNSPTVAAGSKILWKGEITPGTEHVEGIGTFSSTSRFNVEGNAMSLLYGDNFIGQTSLSGKDYAFYKLFYNCTNLVSAENLSLLATTLVIECYYYMFRGCTSLTTAPELPATTLALSCYYYMFASCSSLTTAPQLPATTLASYCYSGMFQQCTSLTTAPELPATTLANHCYNSMFQGCSSLTAAPELPATTLVDSCYQGMFGGCSSFNYIKCLATSISAHLCIDFWVNGVSSSGTFVKSPDISEETWGRGASGIPSGWTVENA